MFRIDDSLISSFSSIDPIYVDGVCGFLNLGENFAQVYYRWQPICAEGCGFRYEKVPTVSIVRPKSSILTCGNHCTFRASVGAQLTPQPVKFGLMAGH